MRFKDFATQAEAEAHIRDNGLMPDADSVDFVTYSRHRCHVRPIMHLEHYADAEWFENTYGIRCKADAG